MEYILKSHEAKSIDTFTIEKIGVPSLVLMERAAFAVADRIIRLFKGEKHSPVIAAVCGKGNNGGDGIAAARILHLRGYKVVIVMAAGRDGLSEDAGRQLAIAENLGMDIYEDYKLEKADVIIDAIFGIGLCREVGGIYLDWIRRIDAAHAYVVAVDIASGVDADNGRILGDAVHADLTVTFGYRKAGHLLYPGAVCCGELSCVEIGFAPFSDASLHASYITYNDADLGNIPPRRPDSNKGSYGRVLVVAGSRNMAGAAYLSAMAAYKTGAGLVEIFTPECNRTILQQLIPEAVMTTYDETRPALCIDALEGRLHAATAVVVGPGLGKTPVAQKLVQEILTRSAVPVVVDADALNIISEHSEWLNSAASPLILTPHLKELSRLTGVSVGELRLRLDEICADYIDLVPCVLVAKDARSRVYERDTWVYINTTGNSGMSVGGSGDVLSGIIAGLLVQGMKASEAARTGVYIHGRAGDLAAQDKSTYSMIAGDLLEYLPEVFKSGLVNNKMR